MLIIPPRPVWKEEVGKAHGDLIHQGLMSRFARRLFRRANNRRSTRGDFAWYCPPGSGLGTPSEYWVEPDGTDTGAGTSGNPYGNVQYALDQIGTSPGQGADGDILHVSATSGADDIVPSGGYDLATYGTPAAGRPLILQGFDSTAKDGDWDTQTGIAGIDCDGNSMWAGSNYDNICLRHLKIHGRSTGTCIDLDNNVLIIECEITGTSGSAVDIDLGGLVWNCWIHDIGAYGVRYHNANGGRAYFNYLSNDGTNDFASGLQVANQYCEAVGNIVSVDGSSEGIRIDGVLSVCAHNSILSSSGTGKGIYIAANADVDAHIHSNLVEGFSGAGGVGIDTSAITTTSIPVMTNNGCYNNTTNYSNTAEFVGLETDNESLSSSPFEKVGADSFSNRVSYFAAADTGSVRGGGYPDSLRRDKGAVQHADPTGGGGGAYIVGS